MTAGRRSPETSGLEEAEPVTGGEDVTARPRLPGVLCLVATPIGNLGDLSPRAERALAEADVIACEDTRRTRQLLSHAGIHDKLLVAVHDHNEARQVRPVLDWLTGGRTVAVVTDAGTPGISDPGARLAAAAAAAGALVTVVPGPSALVAAVAISGLAAGRFCFEGFLPKKGRDRAARLRLLAAERRVTVLFEAPHRLLATLADLEAVCGPARGVVVVRELSKLHEEVWRGTLGGARAWAARTPPRGEHTLVVAGAPAAEGPGDEEVDDAVARLLEEGRSTKEAAAEVAAAMDLPRRRAYEAALRLRSTGEASTGPT
jgi:16S rRNA (cytidine1402-2'-O)-methyltransferase